MPIDLDAAEGFLAATARILDRRRFERHFRGGAAAPVRDAVAAYRTADGGFGHGLEPDGRTPGAQPPAIALALRVLDEADAWDAVLVAGACDWLAAHAPEAGGALFVAPGVDGWPHAPWWAPEPGGPPNLITTGPAAGVLLARGTEHPWLPRAAAWLHEAIDALRDAHPYEVRGALDFLAHAPDRARAGAQVARLEALVRERGLVALDPHAEGETHGPLDFAPRPDAPARAWFDEATIAVHLDALEAAQGGDGGWSFDWLAWSPVAAAEWRGAVTVDALLTLRAYGRLG
jgi:hypothetical protein